MMNKNWKIFEKFNSKFVAQRGDTLRPKLEGICKAENLVYASDAKVLLGIKDSEVPEDIVAENFSIAINICDDTVPIIATVKVKDIKDALAKVPLEEVIEYNDETCEECNGDGVVEYEYIDKDGYTHYRECDCPICDGSGVSSQTVVHTATFVKNDDYMLMFDFIKTHSFYASYIDKLIEVLDYNGNETVDVKQLKCYDYEFIITDKVSVVLCGNCMTPDNCQRNTKFIDI